MTANPEETSNPFEDSYIKAIVDCLVADMRGEDLEFSFELDTLNLNLKVEGESWNGYVDARIANFVLEFDRKLRKAIKELLGDDAPKLPRSFVKVELKDGSAKLKVFVDKILNQLDGMKSKHKKAVLIGLIACFTGVSVTTLITGAVIHSKEVAENAEEEATLQLAITTLGAVTKELAHKKEPYRKLVDGMEKGDTITLASGTEKLTKAEAKKRYIEVEEPPTLEQNRDNIDFPYIVTNLDMEPNPWVATFKYGQHTFEAELIITDAELTEFNELLATKKNAAEEIAIDVQVSVLHNAEGILSAEVQGLGKPRRGSKRLSDLPYIKGSEE
jgi:hypothetical protein